MNKIYLGDSVYVEDGSYKGEIILTTNNGYDDDPRNKITLGLNEVQALIEYLDERGFI